MKNITFSYIEFHLPSGYLCYEITNHLSVITCISYRSSGIIHCQKFSSLTQMDENKKHEIFLLTNNLVNKVLQLVACLHVFLEAWHSCHCCTSSKTDF